jgi:hypothetical protein
MTRTINFSLIPFTLAFGYVARAQTRLNLHSSVNNGSGDASTCSSTVCLNPLPYDYDALEPYISKETLQFHHDKHHAKVKYFLFITPVLIVTYISM